MSEEIEKRLKQLKTEDFIWIIYFVIIATCLYSNVFERHYLIFKDEASKKKYQTLLIIIFSVALIIYAYYLVDSYKDLKELNAMDTNKKRSLTNLSFVGSLLVFISGIIFLYIACKDDNIDVELAFN